MQGASYTTASEVEFSPEQPYQMIDGMEATILIKDLPYRFRLAEKEEVIEFFSNTKKTGPKRMQMV